jgi:hypothetical protein
MKFECGDLDRALADSSLMAEAREHMKICAACRREYRLLSEISTTAKELRQEWETPLLWPSIRKRLEAEPKPVVARWKQWKTWAIAAAALIAISVPVGVWRNSLAPPPDAATASADTSRDFLTDQALQEVEKSEAAYRQSIEKLSRLAAPKLAGTASPALASDRERLALLDSAIAETRANVAQNRFNIRLQTVLAGLYRQKQQTLQEVLTHEAKN